MDQFTDIFIATSFFLFFLYVWWASLQNIDSELFSFIAATKLPLIRTERKKNGSFRSACSVSSREPHNQELGGLKFFLEKIFSFHKWKLF